MVNEIFFKAFKIKLNSILNFFFYVLFEIDFFFVEKLRQNLHTQFLGLEKLK